MVGSERMAAMEKEMKAREKEAEKEAKKRPAASSSAGGSPKKKVKMPGQVSPWSNRVQAALCN